MARQPVFRPAVEALELLEVAEGPLARERILVKHQDNPALQAIIKMTLGPDRYFVRPSPNIVSSSQLSPMESWRAFCALLDQLKNRKLTGNAAKREVRVFLASCRPLLTKWYCRVLNRDLRCGVGIETVTKVFGADFLLADSAVGENWKYSGCALAKDYAKVYKMTAKGERKPTFPLAVESKYDGERANLICFPRERQVFVLTRTGKRRQPIEQVDVYRDQVLDFCGGLNEGVNPYRPLFLDGEFLARKWNDTSSIVRKTKNFDPEMFLREVRTILWDWAPLDDYMKGCFDLQWLRRKAELLRVTGATRPGIQLRRFTRNVWVAGHAMVYDQEQLLQEYQLRLDNEYEGVVLKHPKAPHLFKRTDNLIKLKPEEEKTGRIVDVLIGEDQHAAVPSYVKTKVKRRMESAGPTKETEQYLHCQVDDPPALVKELKALIKGDTEYRLSNHREGVVTFRHGARMGKLVIELPNGDKTNVGTGFAHKAGQDSRAWFWRFRDTVVGLKIDFKQQKGDTADAVSRFPRFVRLREDI